LGNRQIRVRDRAKLWLGYALCTMHCNAHARQSGDPRPCRQRGIEMTPKCSTMHNAYPIHKKFLTITCYFDHVKCFEVVFLRKSNVFFTFAVSFVVLNGIKVVMNAPMYGKRTFYYAQIYIVLNGNNKRSQWNLKEIYWKPPLRRGFDGGDENKPHAIWLFTNSHDCLIGIISFYIH